VINNTPNDWQGTPEEASRPKRRPLSCFEWFLIAVLSALAVGVISGYLWGYFAHQQEPGSALQEFQATLKGAMLGFLCVFVCVTVLGLSVTGSRRGKR